VKEKGKDCVSGREEALKENASEEMKLRFLKQDCSRIRSYVDFPVTFDR
jgi:hypothetical protein